MKNTRHYFLHDVNPVIRFLIISDIIIMGSAGLLAPIFALFVDNFIATDNVAAVVGVAASIYFVTKSVLQIPAAAIIDKIPGERDDFRVLFISSICMGLVPLLYLVIHSPGQLYLAQALLGIAAAFSFPSYMAIFTRHIDRKKEGTEWGAYFTLIDLSSAATAAIGGVLASTVGFHTLIVGLVALNMLGTLLLIPVRSRMRMPRAS